MNHFVNGVNIYPPFPDNTCTIIVGLGCFWGAERCFWVQPDVYVTAVGYAGGNTDNPTYQQVCEGTTNHIEVVMIVYKNHPGALYRLLKVFWQSNDPTQGMRSGNDIGSQYQSVIFCMDEEQYDLSVKMRDTYQNALSNATYGNITTRIEMAPKFYYAEEYHQQYLAKNPSGYCGIKGLVAFPEESDT